MKIPYLVAGGAVAFVEADALADLFAGSCGFCWGHGDECHVLCVAAMAGAMVGEARIWLQGHGFCLVACCWACWKRER